MFGHSEGEEKQNMAYQQSIRWHIGLYVPLSQTCMPAKEACMSNSAPYYTLSWCPVTVSQAEVNSHLDLGLCEARDC